MGNVDWKAVNRRLDYVEHQLRETRQMIAAAEAGEYSPLLSSERFEELFNEAIEATGAKPEAVCVFGMPRPHRCNRCEGLVQAFMKSKAAA